MATDWETISSLATGFGTLVLAVATFGSVRSGSRSARLAERSLLTGLRPLLINSRPDDPMQKVGFADEHWVRLEGGRGSAECENDVIYLTMSVRNAGAGVAVLHGWHIFAGREDDPAEPDPVSFRRLTRDLYIPAGDVGFWQGAMRDPSASEFTAIAGEIAARRLLSIDVLYGDFEGGQRTITRFSLMPAGEDHWLCAIARHWSLDVAAPR